MKRFFLIPSVILAAALIPYVLFPVEAKCSVDEFGNLIRPCGSPGSSDTWLDPILQPFGISDVVLIGKVVSVTKMPDENQTQYNISVEKYLKNPKPYDMITALGNGNSEDFPYLDEVTYYNRPVFDVGNKVFVYLNKENGTYNISPYSFTLDKNVPRGPPPTDVWPTGPDKYEFDYNETITIGGMVKKAYLYHARERDENTMAYVKIYNTNNELYASNLLETKLDGTFTYSFKIKDKLDKDGLYYFDAGLPLENFQGGFIVKPFLLSALNQFKSGVLLPNIKCKDGFQLIIKSVNGLPACVTTQTSKKLGERGWGKDLSTILLEIPLPKISQTEAIKTVENDLKNNVKNSTKILRIVDAIGDQQKYVPFFEFQTSNKTLPLVFVSTNGTLLTVNNASLRINGWCNMGTYTYCGYMQPFNLDYKSRLVYGLDIVYGDNDVDMQPAFYAVDAISGEIVDSSFLRNEAREK